MDEQLHPTVLHDITAYPRHKSDASLAYLCWLKNAWKPQGRVIKPQK